MFGLTSMGIVHTAISLIAVVAGAIALLRSGQIDPRSGLGRIYVYATILTCLTGFFIFQHGGFGKPHALGIITLVVLAVAALAARTQTFGRFSPHVVTVSYSLTFFFHMIPGVTETATRLPPGAPLASSPEAPGLQLVVGVLFVLFLVGAVWQVRRVNANGGRLSALRPVDVDPRPADG